MWWWCGAHENNFWYSVTERAASSTPRENPSGPYQPASAGSRNPARAQEQNLAGADRIDDDLDAAERLLREALTHDLYCGPAHNNLGVVFLKRGQLYEAASEFEWARKLMPGHPDPRLNLGLTLERAVRTDEALAAYTAALEVYSDHLPSMQALVKLQVRAGREDERTERMLKEIALRSEDEGWREWAKEQLVRVGGAIRAK